MSGEEEIENIKESRGKSPVYKTSTKSDRWFLEIQLDFGTLRTTVGWSGKVNVSYSTFLNTRSHIS